MNCLLKVLKASADNNNLPVYGELKLKIKTGTFLQSISAYTSSNCEVAGESGITFKNVGLTTVLSNPFQITSDMGSGFNVVASQDAIVTISNKYGLLQLSGTAKEFGFRGIKDIVGGFESIIIPSGTKKFVFHNSAMSLNILEVGNKLNDIDGIEIIDLGQDSNDNHLTGNISSLVKTGLKNVDLGGNQSVTGDILSFGNITTLENIALRNTLVAGTIESFVAAQRAAGRTTGSVSGNSAGWGNVTFNGSTTNAKGAVSWTATTITMNGVTINA